MLHFSLALWPPAGDRPSLSLGFLSVKWDFNCSFTKCLPLASSRAVNTSNGTNPAFPERTFCQGRRNINIIGEQIADSVREVLWEQNGKKIRIRKVGTSHRIKYGITLGLSKAAGFQQRWEGRREPCRYLRQTVPGRRKGRCKGPEGGVCPSRYSRGRRKVHVAGGAN